MLINARGIIKMLNTFGLLDFSTPDLVIILAVVLLLFGGKKLPELSKSIGESITELKKAGKGVNDLHAEVKNQVSEVKAEITGSHTEA
jgi:sec-independent protein translocase protein TatA